MNVKIKIAKRNCSLSSHLCVYIIMTKVAATRHGFASGHYTVLIR